MNNNPKISVIVPIFNVEKYLSKCLDSICGQTFSNIEIICVYTESSDKTWEELEKYAKKDERIRTVIENEGGRLGGARNYGMRYVTGEYVSFVDSDDWIAVDMLQNMYQMAMEDGTDIVICGINNFDDSMGKLVDGGWGFDLPFPDELFNKSFKFTDLNPYDFISPEAPVVAWDKLYKREFLEKNNIKFPERIRYEDNPFYYEAMIKAEKIRFTRERYYYYRINRAGSLQAASANDSSMLDIVTIMRRCKIVFDENNVSPKFKKELSKYTVGEFTWRYMEMKGSKRKLLASIKENFDTSMYSAVLKELRILGVKPDDPILKKAEEKSVKVSVIIPTYNNAKDIKECLESVLCQSLKETEIICVDDASQDSTGEIMLSLQKNDGRIKIINASQNSGAGVSRNLALKKAVGEYVFFLDGDDLLADTQVLELLYKTASQNNVLACGGNLECFQNDDVNDKVVYSGHFFNTSGMMKYAQYTSHPTWGFTRFLYNLEIILENGIFFPEIRYYEDPVFFVKYMEIVREFYAINKPVYLYRQKKAIKETFNRQKFLDLFGALKNLLVSLGNISPSLYYCEYNTFLQFCKNLYDYISQNQNEKDELAGAADVVFASIDFSKARGYLEESLMFDSFATYVNRQFGKEIAYQGKTAPNTMVDEVVVTGKHMSGGKPTLKRLLKVILKPVYHKFKGKFIEITRTENDRVKNDIVWLTNAATYESEERINKATYEVENHLNKRLSDIEERIYAFEKSFEKSLIGSQNQIKKALTDSESQIKKALTDVEDVINKVAHESEEKINNTVINSEGQIKGFVQNLLAPYSDKVDVLNNYILLNARKEKKIFLIGTPDHNNIGDAAIALGTYEFFSRYFPDYKIIDIPGYHMNEQYYLVHALIDKDDFIFLQGGGNLGDMYLVEEDIRRRVISDFPENKITILPQTIFFSNTDKGKKELENSADIYNRHRNLMLFTRGLESLDFAQKHFSNIKSFNALDMALFLRRQYNFNRQGILLCMRDTKDESAMDDLLQERIIRIVESFDPDYQRTKNQYVSDISLSERALIVNEELMKFAHHKVIVTDRLHGFIFAVITKTPCVVMKAYTQKIREFVSFFEDSDAVFYIDTDVSALQEAIDKALAVDDVKYPILERLPFDDIYRALSD